MNLLSNASKYSHDAGPHLVVGAQPAPAGSCVHVRDEGVGLEPGMADRIFDLFVQAQTSLDRAKGGLGIGLSLAQRLTELHGGTHCCQQRGPRARLRVHRDAADGRVRLTPVSAVESQSTALARRAPAGNQVLVVDDNVDAAHALALLLETQGFRVVVAHDGGGR